MIDGLLADLEALVEVDPGALADSETILKLHRATASLEAVAARATARWDAEQGWAVDGAKSGGAWLAAKTHAPRPEVNRRLRLGRATRSMPHTERAWLQGSITAAHVSALAACRQTASLAEQFPVDEAELVAKATTRSFRRFEQDLAYWRELHDLEDEEKAARRRLEGRRLHLSPGFQGSWILDGELDPINGTIVHDTLGAIERELFEQDWKEARATLGREPVVTDLQRTAAQRRADALVEMAIRSRTKPKDGRRPEPLFTVVLGLPRFEQLCELASRTVVTPGSLVPWFDQAWVERIVFEPPSRVLDVGARRRLFTGADRRAVEVRDENTCFHELCDEPIEEIDHIEPASWGGPTEQRNGRGACAFHNRQRHRRGPPGW
jgi:hypothetical protein